MTSMKRKLIAAALAIAVAIPLSVGGSLASATPAQAGVLSSVKSAAKAVGGKVKTTAKGFGAVAKVVGGQAKLAGRGVGALAKDGAAFAGRTVANGTFKVVHKVEVAGQKARAVGQAIGKRLR